MKEHLNYQPQNCNLYTGINAWNSEWVFTTAVHQYVMWAPLAAGVTRLLWHRASDPMKMQLLDVLPFLRKVPMKLQAVNAQWVVLSTDASIQSIQRGFLEFNA